MSDTIVFNDKEYKLEELSNKARTIITRLQYTSTDMERLRAQMDVLSIADAQLKRMLSEELEAETAEVIEE